MDFRPKICLSHFQLRNLLACTSRNNICYADESKVYAINPLFDQKAIRMDLTDPVVQPANPVIFPGIQISTIAADHNVLVAGGFCGEYGMIALDSPRKADHTEGLITTDMNPITNHVQIHLNRHSGQPQASFASNDTCIRTLDCTTNKVVAHHKYDYPVNCSAISPDHRLRVIVGDNRNVIICDAEKGDVLQDLSGHQDYGFACAWADNGWHVATGNQDKLIQIWDARMWTDHQGLGKPVETIACTITGARSLRYSPLGSGKRVLVAAEAADMVSIIDAEAYKTKQSFDFFGEISGVDFTPDGQALFIGITDSIRGGIMEFEKCGSRGFYGIKDPYDQYRARTEEPNGIGFDERASGLDWKKTDAEVAHDSRSRRTATHRQRRAAQSWDIGPF
jgi:WD40 repeat protein